MEKQTSYKLIEGKFEPSEARQILFDLFGSKIKYHNSEIIHIRETSSGDTSHSEERIKALNNARDSIKEIAEYALEKGLKLKIDSRVEIRLE